MSFWFAFLDTKAQKANYNVLVVLQTNKRHHGALVRALDVRCGCKVFSGVPWVSGTRGKKWNQPHFSWFFFTKKFQNGWPVTNFSHFQKWKAKAKKQKVLHFPKAWKVYTGLRYMVPRAYKLLKLFLYYILRLYTCTLILLSLSKLWQMVGPIF